MNAGQVQQTTHMQMMALRRTIGNAYQIQPSTAMQACCTVLGSSLIISYTKLYPEISGTCIEFVCFKIDI